MGWDAIHVDPNENGHIDVKAALDNEFCPGSLVTSAVVAKPHGDTYYAAVRKEGGDIYAVVIFTEIDEDDFANLMFKVTTENMGPSEAECPTDILSMLAPTSNNWAHEWRAACIKHAVRHARTVGTLS